MCDDRRGPCWPGRRPIRYGVICGCPFHPVYPGQNKKKAWRSPSLSKLLTTVEKRLGPGHVDSDPLGSCIPDGDFIEEIHAPILRCHVSTLAFGSPEPTCKAAGDCGGRGCPVPVQNDNSAHCPKRYCSANQTGRSRPINSWVQSTFYCTSAHSDKPSSKRLCHFFYAYRPKAILSPRTANREAYKTKSIIYTLVIVMIKGFQIIDTNMLK